MIDVGDLVAGSEQLAPGQTSYSITVPLAPNQPNNFLITSTDAGGNQSSPTVVPTITQDSTPPVLPVITSTHRSGHGQHPERSDHRNGRSRQPGADLRR